jgi:ABC-type transporter Mla maintaining outer membrane lipid asymmetry ATPase subunit MlaF
LGEGEGIIRLEEVIASSAGYEILKSVSVAFPEGLTTAVIGQVGSGKSTLLKVAAGIFPPDSGKVLYKGRDIYQMGREEDLAFRGQASFVFQDAALWSNQTIYNNLALPLRLHRRKASESELDGVIREKLGLVGYEESLNIRPAELSMGEQKLISLARALVLDPGLIFYDEPAASLDDSSKARVLSIIAEQRKLGRTQIIVTNSSELVNAAADCLCILDQGDVRAMGPFEEIRGTKDPVVMALIRRLRKRE